MKEPKAIIENGIVVNADQLRRYWAERHHQDYIAKRERSYAHSRYHGWPDPGSDYPEEDKPVEAKEPRQRPAVIYQMDAKDTPAFKELNERINLMNDRLTKYFGSKNKSRPSPF